MWDHTYGSRCMYEALRALGYLLGPHQARGLLRVAGVWVDYRRRYRTTTKSNHRQRVFDKRLERVFPMDGPNHAYVDDIT